MSDLVPTSPVSGGDLSKVTAADLCAPCEGVGILKNSLTCPACDGTGRPHDPPRDVCQNCNAQRRIVAVIWKGDDAAGEHEIDCPTCKATGLQPSSSELTGPAITAFGTFLGGYGWLLSVTEPVFAPMVAGVGIIAFLAGLGITGYRAIAQLKRQKQRPAK